MLTPEQIKEMELSFGPESVIMPGDIGMHARPAGRLRILLKDFKESELWVVSKNGTKANAKSIAALLSMGVEGGEELFLYTKGAEAEALLKTVIQAFKDGLGELSPASVSKEEPQTQKIETPILKAEKKIEGLCVSRGYALGVLFVYHGAKLEIPASLQVKSQKEELESLNQALETTHQSYTKKASTLPKDSAQRTILEMHDALLEDEELLEVAHKHIRSGLPAAIAWQKSYQATQKSLASHDNPLIAERATDILDVGTHVLASLLSISLDDGLESLPKGSILVAEDLTPSDVSKINPEHVRGIALSLGGRNSHATIIARSLGIPLIIALGDSILSLPSGARAILDDQHNTLFISPDDASWQLAEMHHQKELEKSETDFKMRFKPCTLKSGETIPILGNTGDVSSTQRSITQGADGVGLMRSEFLFLERRTAPTEEEQTEIYTQLLAAAEGKSTVIRTLDIGSDKPVPYLSNPSEENPALGVRGIRLFATNKPLAREQIRALLKSAKVHDNLSIMFPMVASLRDLRLGKQIVQEESDALNFKGKVLVGIMIEVPSAVMMAKELSEIADFFSIGTNDLSSYVLAMDRASAPLASRVDALHPSVLRMIDILRKNTPESTPLSVCGGLASDPLGSLILIGLGINKLSVEPSMIPTIKAGLRHYSLETLKDFAKKALACGNLEDVQSLTLPPRNS